MRDERGKIDQVRGRSAQGVENDVQGFSLTVVGATAGSIRHPLDRRSARAFLSSAEASSSSSASSPPSDASDAFGADASLVPRLAATAPASTSARASAAVRRARRLHRRQTLGRRRRAALHALHDGVSHDAIEHGTQKVLQRFTSRHERGGGASPNTRSKTPTRSRPVARRHGHVLGATLSVLARQRSSAFERLERALARLGRTFDRIDVVW